MEISELPDFPAIQKVGEALWGKGDVRGAAVMVGAGFSRFATFNSASTAEPPLWEDFSDRMQAELYPNGNAPCDPLRLAQEYKAALGEVAVDGLIRSLIQDDKWHPSDFHETLLSLPWSDVLTTNWDTLLERTELLETERAYEIVRTTSDIARTKAPRIVKLHGSFPANEPFIFTQEDYRRYPEKFASFVNLAQQVLLENELCLLGFSGNDPNFLNWAGWVRDNLGDASRRIRLVGVLGLSPSRREMLKQQNVTPIDLAPIVEGTPDDKKHSKAIWMFLQWLLSSKPAETHIWVRPSEEAMPGPSTPDAAEPNLSAIASNWRKDRLSYPGWLVPPWKTQKSLRFATDRLYPSPKQLMHEKDAVTKMHLLFELACRHEIAFWPLSKQYAKAIETAFSEGGDTHLTQGEKTRLCAFLYAEARRRWDWESFDFWASHLRAFDDPQAAVELIYGRALRAKLEFDYDTLEDLVPQIMGDDPVWKMRQGMLYTFLSEDEKAALCFRAALTDVRKRRARDKESIWLLSREAWATLVFQAAWTELPENQGKFYRNFGDWPAHYGQRKCDPWDYISFTDSKTAEAFEKAQSKPNSKTALFNAGHFRSRRVEMRFSNHAEVSALDLHIRLQEVAGIPSQMGMKNLLASRLSRAFGYENRHFERDFFLAANFLTNAREGLIDIAFNRIEVAKIPLDVVTKLAKRLKQATDHLLGKQKAEDSKQETIERIRTNIELISRLSVRLSVDEAGEFYQWALELCKSSAANHFWLYEHIGNVLKRTLEVFPKAKRAHLAATAIFLPLPGERSSEETMEEWPELVSEFEYSDFSRPENSPEWSARIAALIKAIRVGEELDRSRAIVRMRALHMAGLLKAGEQGSLAEAIWAKTATSGGWPSGHQLYPSVFLDLPQLEEGHAEELFCSGLLKAAANGAVDFHVLNAISVGLNSSTTTLERSRERFSQILSSCMKWKPQTTKSKYISQLTGHVDDNNERAIANFLAGTLLPQMQVEEIPENLKEIWAEHLRDPDSRYMVATAFEFSRIFPLESSEAVQAIRKAIYSRDSQKVAFGFFAIKGFVEAATKKVIEFPKIIASDIVSACEGMKEPRLDLALHTASQLIGSHIIDVEDKQRLAESVELIWSEYSYNVEVKNEERIIILTLVRSECAHLAKALIDCGLINEGVRSIYEEAKIDPIPEVRHAV